MIKKIISSGQPGASRAALDWALTHGIDYGGWCPRGRKVHDGKLDSRYELIEETQESGNDQSTRWNVRDGDGTVVFTLEPKLRRHAKKVFRIAEESGKPCLHIAGVDEENGSEALRKFIEENDIAVLMIAGSHESMELGIYFFTEDTLNETFGCDSQAI